MTRSDSVTRVAFTSAAQKLSVTIAGSGVLDEARRMLDQQLVELKDALPGLEVDDRRAEDVFMQLRSIGLLQLFTIFDPPYVDQVRQFFVREFPFRRNPAYAPLIECIGEREAMLPLEYLPLLGLQPPDRIENRADFVAACRDLIGFSCIVRRSILPARLPGGSALRVDEQGRLPLRFLQYEGLPGADRELKWFTSQAVGRVEIVGPYPTGGDGDPALSHQIFDPQAAQDATRRGMPDQIQHFACHCYSRAKSPLENEIELSKGGHDVRTRLSDIAADLMQRRFAGHPRSVDLPLVVMNACGSSRLAASSSVSFPWLFLKNGNRGFVGSDIEIPDDVAAEFSAAFYDRFLVRRQPLGESFQGARQHMLHKFGNPLGLAYSSYADPDLHVCIDPEEHHP